MRATASFNPMQEEKKRTMKENRDKKKTKRKSPLKNFALKKKHLRLQNALDQYAVN